MPYMSGGKRDYKKEYEKYASKPKAKKDRAMRNAARRTMMENGKAAKGDGKDVGHRKAISKGGKNSLGNLFSQDVSANRSFSRNKNGTMKSERSRKGK